jgi:hypothetical protein
MFTLVKKFYSQKFNNIKINDFNELANFYEKINQKDFLVFKKILLLKYKSGEVFLKIKKCQS